MRYDETPAVTVSINTLKLTRIGAIDRMIRKPSSIPFPYNLHIAARETSTPIPGTEPANKEVSILNNIIQSMPVGLIARLEYDLRTKKKVILVTAAVPAFQRV